MDRAEPLGLALASLKQSSQNEYRGAIASFLRHCRRKRLRMDNWDAVDYNLCHYMVHTFRRSGNASGRQKCSKARSALLFFCPELSNKLVLSNKSLRGWEKLAPSQQHVPFPYELAVGVAYQLFRRGLVEMAIGVLLQFDCYLRINELLALKSTDIIFLAHPPSPTSALPIDSGTLILLRTKGGTNQSVTFRGPLLHVWLRRLTTSAGPHAKVFRFSEDSFRRNIATALRSLSCPFLKVSSHGLRHGGATHDAERNVPLATIQLRGRWRRASTVYQYLQQGVVASVRAQIPTATGRLLHRLCSNLLYYFNVDDFVGGGGDQGTS